MDPNSICRKTKRLAGKQAELCQLEPEIVQEVAKGTKLGVRECQYQFRFRRWNCTSHSKYFGKILQQGKASASSASHLPKSLQPPGHVSARDSWSRVWACKPVCACACACVCVCCSVLPSAVMLRFYCRDMSPRVVMKQLPMLPDSTGLHKAQECTLVWQ